MPVPEVSVVIPARDAQDTIGRTLAALAAQEGAPPFEVLVVDDGSSDATPQIVQAAGGNVRLIAGAGEGPGAARNRAVAAAAAPVIAFTDADCFPRPEWLAAGLAALQAAEIVQGRVTPDPESEHWAFDRTIWIEGLTGFFETANLFIRKHDFEQAGGFEPWLAPARSKELAEDVWLGWRVRRAGGRAVFEPRAHVHHAIFRRGIREFVAEQLRRRYFPEIARRIPEMRTETFHRRVFVTPRSMRFDLALAGISAAAIRRSPLPLLAVLPYAGVIRSVLDPLPPEIRSRAAAAHLAADAASLAALIYGSAKARSPLL